MGDGGDGGRREEERDTDWEGTGFSRSTAFGCRVDDGGKKLRGPFRLSLERLIKARRLHVGSVQKPAINRVC